MNLGEYIQHGSGSPVRTQGGKVHWLFLSTGITHAHTSCYHGHSCQPRFPLDRGGVEIDDRTAPCLGNACKLVVSRWIRMWQRQPCSNTRRKGPLVVLVHRNHARAHIVLSRTQLPATRWIQGAPNQALVFFFFQSLLTVGPICLDRQVVLFMDSLVMYYF